MEVEALKVGTGCLAKSAPDEPVFILCARDVIAAECVREWGNRADAIGVPVEKVGAAFALADAMDAWRAENPDKCKVPD